MDDVFDSRLKEFAERVKLIFDMEVDGLSLGKRSMEKNLIN